MKNRDAWTSLSQETKEELDKLLNEIEEQKRQAFRLEQEQKMRDVILVLEQIEAETRKLQDSAVNG